MQDPWDIYHPDQLGARHEPRRRLLRRCFLVAAVVRRRGSPGRDRVTVVYLLVSWGLVLSSDRFTSTRLLVAAGTGRYATDILPGRGADVVAFLTTQTVLEPDVGRSDGSCPPRWSRVGRRSCGSVAAWSSPRWSSVNVGTWWVARESRPRPWVDAIVDRQQARGRGDAASARVLPRRRHPPHPLPGNATSSRVCWSRSTCRCASTHRRDLLLIPDADGHLKEAEVVNYAAKNEPTDNPDCGFLVRPGKTTTIPMTIDLYGFAWAVQLDYFAELPTQVTVSTDTVDLELDLQQGLRRMQFAVNDSIASFTVSAPADATPVCVTQVFIGSFGASDRSPFQPPVQ